MKKRIKTILYSVFKIKFFNLFIVLLYKVSSSLGIKKLNNIFQKFPYTGKFKVVMDNNTSFLMKSDGSDSIASDLYWKGIHAYEPNTVNTFLKLLQKNVKVFIDIGANTGFYALIAASFDKSMRVFAFEPIDSAFDIMKGNKEINKFDNLVVEKKAVSDFDGISKFNLQKTSSPKIPLGSSLRTDMGDQEDMIIIDVPTIKLDSYFKDNKIDGLDILQIDTEGTEDKVLKGAENVLNKYRPLIICEVLSNLIEDKLHSVMDGRKYLYFYVEENKILQCEKIVGDPYVVSNYLFIPEEKISQYFEGYTIEKAEKKIFK
ncbi:MAG: FkbM family methyltransferase [Ignavibacteriae bacterium]|nr:MAG: FkbM family methyltransferase [Ignavibacteriota bacterium]